MRGSQESEDRSQNEAGARLLSSVFCLLSSTFRSFSLRNLAWIFLALLFLAALFSDRIAGASYAHQFRDFPGARMSWHFPLGTDALGRDRLARLLAATRISLLLAPAAAVFSTALAALIGSIAGYCGGLTDRIAARAIDLMLSLPWIFLLIAARALLPLNVSPSASVLVTFALLGALGWAPSARVIRAGVRDMRDSDFMLQARACGCRGFRLVLRQLAPNLKPVLLAQFWTSIPLFILSEANLGLLGLGVSDPLPSWGNLLRELETDLAFNPGILACLVVMLVVLGCFHVVTRSRESEVRSQNNAGASSVF
jgi:peptide/nickel transport system permease protein